MSKVSVTLTKDQAEYIIAVLEVDNHDTKYLRHHLSEQAKQNKIAYNTRIITKLSRAELELS